MGTKGIEIVGTDVKELVELLNRAFCDEWLAYYQYWIGAKVTRGPMKEAVIAELTQHAADELHHAELLALRVIQLGGTPVTTPARWQELSNCAYEPPDQPSIKEILAQNIRGEQCAIATYKRLIDLIKDRDPISYHIVLEVLEDEVEHEEDLQSQLEDLEVLLALRADTKR